MAPPKKRPVQHSWLSASPADPHDPLNGKAMQKLKAILATPNMTKFLSDCETMHVDVDKKLYKQAMTSKSGNGFFEATVPVTAIDPLSLSQDSAPSWANLEPPDS